MMKRRLSNEVRLKVPETLRHMGGATAAIGILALIVAALVAWWRPAALPGAWRCATFVIVGAALGSMSWILIHQLTGGEWVRGLKPFLLAATRLVPWTLLLFVPLLVTGSPTGGVIARTVLCGAVFAGIAWAAVRAGRFERTASRWAWVGPVGLIALLFLNHVVVGDWISSLDEHWTSTAFPVIWLIGQSVFALSAAMMKAMIGGANPRQPVVEGRPIGIDWGTLLFSAVMLWCYIAFAQFLIVWSGNLPKETTWFIRRTHGGWVIVPWILLALHFVLPLVVLLSRRAKQSRGALMIVSLLLMAAQVVHTIWLIVPAYDGQRSTLGLTLLLLAGLGGLGLNRSLAWAAKEGRTP